MDLYPAIDLRHGRCVRLLQGDYSREVRYDADPVSVARRFAEAGVAWIHVVDLDAARTGSSGATGSDSHGTVNGTVNRAVIAEICAAVPVPVQCGGGVRSVEDADALAVAGVERCVLGTAAIEEPALVERLAAAGHRVAVGLDVRGTEVATRGWEHSTGLELAEVLSETLPRFEQAGVEAVVVTQIWRDAMGTGADIEGLAEVLKVTPLAVIASGGIGTLEHIAELAALRIGDQSAKQRPSHQAERRLSGAICGKALYDDRFTITAALAAAGNPPESRVGDAMPGSQL